MKLKYDFAIQEVADKFVAVGKDPETQTVEQVFNLNDTGALILQALQNGNDVPTIVSLLLSKYDVTQQEAKIEVKEFIAMLKDNGLAF